jgi:hypothetical protein
MIDERWLEIREYAGPGFQPLIDFGGWRVAMLRYDERDDAQASLIMERHTQTDEVFVLIGGEAILLLGGTGPQVEAVASVRMEPRKLYNVRENAWHSILLSRDASILIVENRDTAEANSEYAELAPAQRAQILDIRKRAGLK